MNDLSFLEEGLVQEFARSKSRSTATTGSGFNDVDFRVIYGIQRLSVRLVIENQLQRSYGINVAGNFD